MLAFCDADDIVGEGWVAAMGSALRQHPFVTGPIERTLLNQDWLCAAYGSSGGSEPDTFAGTFPFSTSANVGLQRQCFEDLAGFDESLQVGEDIELSMRLWQDAVSTCTSDPEALVHYRLRHNLRTSGASRTSTERQR